MQDYIFVGLVVSLQRQLCTSSAINLLNNNSPGSGMDEREVERHVSAGQFHIIGQSVENILSVLVADLHAIYTFSQRELRHSVLVGFSLVRISTVDIFNLYGHSFPEMIRVSVRIYGSNLQAVQLVVIRILFIDICASRKDASHC